MANNPAVRAHVSLVDPRRVAVVRRMVAHLGLANDSELVRRLIDQEAARLGLAELPAAQAEKEAA